MNNTHTYRKSFCIVSFGRLYNIIKPVINFTGFFILCKWMVKTEAVD